MFNGLTAYFARNRVAANLLMAFFIVGGLIAGFQVPVQLLPEIDPRVISVTVPVPGASAREIEEDVNRHVEESLVGLRGVDRVVTIAKEGVGQVNIELSTSVKYSLLSLSVLLFNLSMPPDGIIFRGCSRK